MPPRDAIQTHMTRPGDGLTVYYDGACPLCSTEIGYYASRKGGTALCMVDISKETADTGADLDREAALHRLHVRRSDGSLLSGAAAFAAIWETLPGWRMAGRVAQMRPVNLLLETAYRAFLIVRPQVSRFAGWWTR